MRASAACRAGPRCFAASTSAQSPPARRAATELTASSHLKPSYGWFEYVDIDYTFRTDDGTLTPSHSLYQWQQVIFEATERAGKPARYDHRTGPMLRDCGLVDIQEVVIKLPINPWPTDTFEKECGRWFNLGLTEGLEAFSLGPLTRVMGWSKQDVENFITPVAKECARRSIHAYCLVWVLCFLTEWAFSDSLQAHLDSTTTIDGSHLPPIVRKPAGPRRPRRHERYDTKFHHDLIPRGSGLDFGVYT